MSAFVHAHENVAFFGTYVIMISSETLSVYVANVLASVVEKLLLPIYW